MPFIMFRSDIDKYKPYIHLETKNRSFVKIAEVLRQMGIKNNFFFLSLINESLKYVDPFSDNLDDTTKALILAEAKLNPWYFFRECLRVPKSGGDYGYFELSRGNLALMWAVYNDIDVGEIMPRQTGKSYATQSIFVHLLYILCDNVNIAHYDKDQPNCINVIRTIKSLRDGLPKWIFQRSSVDTDAKESISYSKKHNKYDTYPAPIDEKSALNLGRGQTLTFIHFDEIAFFRYNWIAVSAATAAMSSASDAARAVGLPSVIIYTTTAGDPSKRHGAYALSIFSNACPFNERMYDLENNQALKETVRANSSNNVLFMEFSYKQLGFDDKWLEDRFRRSNASSASDNERDYLNRWVSTADNTILDKKTVERLNNSARDPNFTQLADGLLVRWYVPESTYNRDEFKRIPFIMGMDTSENIGNDFTTMTIIDPRDMGVVATFRCNDSNTMQVANTTLQMLLDFPRAVWIPERQSTATVIIDYVIDGLVRNNFNPYFRIYNDVVQTYDDPKVQASVNIYNGAPTGKARSAFGYRTGGSGKNSRDILYKNTMTRSLQINASRIYDQILIREFTLLRMKNGRIDHTDGGHDDQVISYLLACYLVFFGKNIKYYGIEPQEYLTVVNEEMATVEPELRKEQLSIRKRISELEDMLIDTNSRIVRKNYERELSNLKTLVDDKINIVNPVAVEQAKLQHQALRTSSQHRLSVFSRRFSNALNRR